MTFEDFVELIVGCLRDSNVPFMVSGSIASSFHGEPRLTNDIDVVIDPTTPQLRAFVEHLRTRDDLHLAGADGALEARTMFNVLHLGAGWKIDLVVRKDRPFSRTEFDRRTTEVVAGLQIEIVSAEDSILSKLEWSKETGSQQQGRDVVGVLRRNAGLLDWDYLDHWATELGVLDQLLRLRVEAEQL